MIVSRPFMARRAGTARILSLLLLAGCTAESPTSSVPQVPSFAPGSGGGPSVRSTEPDTGLRNTTLDVRVLGSGFDNGSQAVWALAGDTAFATTRVTVNSTRFVKSGELVANITIAADAPLALFDVVVITLAGKKGIGIEKFAVQDSDRYTAVFGDASADRVRSDDGTAYMDGSPGYDLNCVTSQRFPGGLYQLRTVAATGACKAVQRPGWRWFTFDLGAGNTLDLDQDGTAEPIEQAPGRLLADDTFAQGATGTLGKIYIFIVNPDGSTEWDAKYELRYRADLAVTVLAGGGRLLEASAGTATVDIYNKWRAGKPLGSPIATVDLPFTLTLTPVLAP
ncbi:MAG TPA: hypothetical protein VJ817_16015 [Gemmatimonadales bacterium]|nr:hypothetical protein [Gemmatimonadales bacterium]